MAHERAASEGRGGPSPRLVAIGVLVVVLVWFAIVNLDEVPVTFLVTTRETPLVVALGIAALLGLGIGYVAGRAAQRRRL